jgi:hypothetical protein
MQYKIYKQQKQNNTIVRRRSCSSEVLVLSSFILVSIQLVFISNLVQGFVLFPTTRKATKIITTGTRTRTTLKMNVKSSITRHLQGCCKGGGSSTCNIQRKSIRSMSHLFLSTQHYNNHSISSIPNPREIRRNQFLLQARTSSSSSSSPSKNDNNNSNKKKSAKKMKIKLADPSQIDLNALSMAFDEMAKKDGFDESLAFYADEESFEDDFDYNDLDDTDDDDEDNDDDDEFIDFGSEFDDDNNGDSMEERLKAAKRDADLGRVSVPDDLDEFSTKITRDELRKLGFKQELNPFGNDETPRKDSFKLLTNAMVCSACGSRFQSKNEDKPGFLPLAKYETQVKLSKIEEVQRIQDKAQSDDWSPEDEIEWLIQSESSSNPGDGGEGIDIETMADELGIDLVELTKEKKTICKRCHGLQNFGEVPESLRPGWSDEPLLSQEKFRKLLLPLKERPAVIIALVDLFDFSGSILPELDAIAGDNPVIIAANKADLLPSKMGQTRAENWVRRELEYLGVKSIANIGGAVRLVSCKTGFGIAQMLGKARGMAEDMDCDIYIVGAANAGKSTLINQIMAKNDKSKPQEKKRPGTANQWKGVVTASPLPGTTLEFIKVDIGDGQVLYDTPGLLVPNTLTQRLTPSELKMVVPKR